MNNLSVRCTLYIHLLVQIRDEKYGCYIVMCENSSDKRSSILIIFIARYLPGNLFKYFIQIKTAIDNMKTCKALEDLFIPAHKPAGSCNFRVLSCRDSSVGRASD